MLCFAMPLYYSTQVLLADGGPTCSLAARGVVRGKGLVLGPADGWRTREPNGAASLL